MYFEHSGETYHRLDLRNAVSELQSDAVMGNTQTWDMWQLERMSRALDKKLFASANIPDANFFEAEKVGKHLIMVNKPFVADYVYAEGLPKSAAFVYGYDLDKDIFIGSDSSLGEEIEIKPSDIHKLYWLG